MFKISHQLTKYLLGAGLTAIATAFLVNSVYSQPHNNLHPSKYTAINTVSLAEIASNLRKSNLLAEASYQEVLRSVKNGSLDSRSKLLTILADNSVKHYLGS